MSNYSTTFWVCIFVVLAIVLVAGYTWGTLSWSLSTGDRAGFIQKFSHKGWICKTWEGELQMTPVLGAIPEIFLFSVPDDTIAEKINRLIGKNVILHYEQHAGVPTTFFGETGYFVTDVKEVE